MPLCEHFNQANVLRIYGCKRLQWVKHTVLTSNSAAMHCSEGVRSARLIEVRRSLLYQPLQGR